MELKDFISQALIDIAQGVATGAEAVAALSGVVNPKPGGDSRGVTVHHATLSTIIDVQFNVALTVSEGSKTGGGVGVVLGVFSAGGRTDSSGSSESSTHLKFHVPMALPRFADRPNPKTTVTQG
jgi:hypothetical protein